MNRARFFSEIKQHLFHGQFDKGQVEGIDGILDAAAMADVKDPRYLAYILATAYHETGTRMSPVREGFSKTDAGARRVVAKYKYGKPDPVTGHVYYGRGQVQLTWAENYKTMGRLLGLDLYRNPDLALDPLTSARILVEGMVRGKSGKGDFTGKCLEDYFNSSLNDPVGARRIINGQDRAGDIASYHQTFLAALRVAGQ